MLRKIDLSSLQITQKSLIKRMLIGAAIGLTLISSLLYSVKNPDPNWGSLWYIRPLIMVPLAGAFGSLVFYTPKFIKSESSWKKVLVLILNTFAFIVALWMGIVLGLDGTLWD